MKHPFFSFKLCTISLCLLLSSYSLSQLNSDSRVNPIETANQMGESEVEVALIQPNDSILISHEKLVAEDINLLMNEERKRLETYRTNVYYLLIFLFIGFLVKAYFIYRYYKKMKRQREKILIENKNLLKTKQENKELHLKINTAFDEVVQLAKENNPEFLARFQEVYPHCYNKLVELYPGLQTSELKFCAMLYLNFSSKDIAEFTFVTPKAVQNRKNRMRKKLNISSEEDLSLWMKKICA